MDYIYHKILQYAFSIIASLILAMDTTINFFVPCLLAIVLDIISAWLLGRRMHRRHPEACDGKFKSEYKFRVLYTMIIVFLAVILADYTDRLVLKDTDVTVRFVVGVFLFYEVWSCLENWSSENDRPLARALQRIMVNKAERHLNVPLEDIFFDEYGEEKDDGKENGNDSQTPNNPKP